DLDTALYQCGPDKWFFLICINIEFRPQNFDLLLWCQYLKGATAIVSNFKIHFTSNMHHPLMRCNTRWKGYRRCIVEPYFRSIGQGHPIYPSLGSLNSIENRHSRA